MRILQALMLILVIMFGWLVWRIESGTIFVPTVEQLQQHAAKSKALFEQVQRDVAAKGLNKP